MYRDPAILTSNSKGETHSKYSGAADIWSAAAVILEMETGNHFVEYGMAIANYIKKMRKANRQHDIFFQEEFVRARAVLDYINDRLTDKTTLYEGVSDLTLRGLLNQVFYSVEELRPTATQLLAYLK